MFDLSALSFCPIYSVIQNALFTMHLCYIKSLIYYFPFTFWVKSSWKHEYVLLTSMCLVTLIIKISDQMDPTVQWCLKKVRESTGNGDRFNKNRKTFNYFVLHNWLNYLSFKKKLCECMTTNIPYNLGWRWSALRCSGRLFIPNFNPFFLWKVLNKCI